MSHANLACGKYIGWSGTNPFESYRILKELKEHWRHCLPCLLSGSFQSNMEKEIQRLVLVTALRLAAIILSWGCTLAAFVFIHMNNRVLSDTDLPFIIPTIGSIIITAVSLTADGPSEYGR